MHQPDIANSPIIFVMLTGIKDKKAVILGFEVALQLHNELFALFEK